MFNTTVPQYETFLSLKYRSAITWQYRRDGWHVIGPGSSLKQPSGQLIASDRVGFEAVLLLYKTVQFFLSIQLGIHAFKRLTISIV